MDESSNKNIVLTIDDIVAATGNTKIELIITLTDEKPTYELYPVK